MFSTNIEKELQDKKIDIAVHALKDMPAIETDGLRTNTFLERNDPREILITKDKKKLKELKVKAIIGTSSYRREFQLKKLDLILIINLSEEMLIQELKNLMMVYMMQ